MRPDRTNLPRTNFASLAAATGIVVFMAWMASFAMPRDSLFTRDQLTSPPAAAAPAQPAQAREAPNRD